MNKEDLEAIEFWKDCIEHLEKEFQYPNYLGYFITIRDKECEYLKTTLNLIDKLQQKVNQLETNRDEAIKLIKSKNNGVCIKNGIEKNAYTFLLDFDEAREFVWELEEILERGKE